MKPIPDFKSEIERRQWFIDNAQYFTAVSRRHMHNERTEHKTREDAVKFAAESLRNDPQARPYMIYAVVNNSDVWVENIIRKE
jgi:hypothetical protein